MTIAFVPVIVHSSMVSVHFYGQTQHPVVAQPQAKDQCSYMQLAYWNDVTAINVVLPSALSGH